MDLQERVALVLKEQKIDQAELVKVTGKSKGLVSQWVNGPAKTMSYDDARKISAKYGYGVEWLMRDSGPKLESKARSPASEHRNVALGPDVVRYVPLISWVIAGKFEAAVDTMHVGEAEAWYPGHRRFGEHVYALRVEGDSMTAQHGKSYPAGSIIFVDPDQRSPASGQRVIAKLKGSDEVTFKVFIRETGRIFLKPLNSHYPTINDPFKVIGTIVGKWEDE